jgi:hypothetical protein
LYARKHKVLTAPFVIRKDCYHKPRGWSIHWRQNRIFYLFFTRRWSNGF